MGINKKGEKENFLTSIYAIFNFIGIFLSPALVFGLIGFLVYYNSSSYLYEILGYSIIILGTILGILFGLYVRKKHGLIEFMSSLSSTADLDNITNHTKKE